MVLIELSTGTILALFLTLLPQNLTEIRSYFILFLALSCFTVT
jgi:hypothetical protein